jgi:hypothetical protein
MTERETKNFLAALPTKWVDILPEDAEDRECMCAEVESVSEITREWAEVRERGYKARGKT